MNTQSYAEENHSNFYSQLLINITFYLIVNVVLLNIIFGIIIDTFGELR